MKPRLRKTPTDPGSSVSRRRAEAEPGFTLVELLIVVAVIGLLAVLAIYNFRLAIERTLRAADAGNLRAIGAALQSYYIDHGDLPPADREAGPFMSHGRQFTDVGNGPAAGGSWDGVPWLLFEFGYIEDWGALFCPKYLKLYRGGATIRGGHPRFHNFRYAYNSSALSSGGPPRRSGKHHQRNDLARPGSVSTRPEGVVRRSLSPLSGRL